MTQYPLRPSQLKNLSDVAFTGDYQDLLNKPDINSVSQKNIYIANENILSFQPVTFMGTLLNTDNLTHANRFFGLSITDTLTGFEGTLISEGEIINPAWNWNIGENIFLNGNDISNIAPYTGFSQLIGQAKNQTTIILSKNQALIY